MTEDESADLTIEFWRAMVTRIGCEICAVMGVILEIILKSNKRS